MGVSEHYFTASPVVEPEERTHRFSIDIHDDAFTQTRSAAELWVGADDNFVPIKIRAKLKIGYAEVYFRSASRLKAPLTCRTEVK